MRNQPVEVVRRFLQGSSCRTTLSAMIAKKAKLIARETLVEVNEEPDRAIEPDQSLLDAAIALLHCSGKRDVNVLSLFGAGGNVAVFGTITEVRSFGEASTYPFSLWVKVTNGKIASMQYLEGEATSALPFFFDAW
jgi:hypothetical protein